MKKLVCVLAAVACAATAFGQGTIIFANNAATAVTNSSTGARAAVGTHAALYFSTDLGAAESALTMSGDVNTNLFLAGLFNGGTRTMTGTTGTILAQIRAWSGAYSSYEAAFATGDPTVFAGKSGTFQITLGGGTVLPTSVATRMSAFTISPVPEPSTLALGAMGLLGLYLIRRRR